MDSEQESNTEMVLIQTIHITQKDAGLKQLRLGTNMVKAIRTSGMILIV